MNLVFMKVEELACKATAWANFVPSKVLTKLFFIDDLINDSKA